MERAVFPFRMPGAVWAAPGALAKLVDEARRLGGQRALVVTDRGLPATGIPDRVLGLLKEAGFEAQLHAEVQPEPPLADVERVRALVRDGRFDLVVGVGGGSSIDVAKTAAALSQEDAPATDFFGIDLIRRGGPPAIAIPTTAGTGAEVTANAIFTDPRDSLKKGMVSRHLIPAVAIVDAELTLSLPPAITAATGMDALTHAIESYTAMRAAPLSDVYAAEAIRLAGGALRTAVHQGGNLAAREAMAMASLMAGISLANAGVGAVHALAYPLGGQFGVPHGVANSLLLPYVLEYNLVALPERFGQVAALLGEPVAGLSPVAAAERALEAVRRLSRDVGIPARMSAFGVTEAHIPGMAEQAHATRRLMDNNPRRLTLAEVREIYRAAL